MAIKIVKAVTITGDVVASSRLPPLQRKKLQNRIDRLAQLFIKQYPDLQLQQYRGDSVQATLTKNRMHGLSIALQLQCFLLAERFQIRLSLGAGEINFRGKDVITSDGTAFQASGHLIDELKKQNELIAVTGADVDFAAEWGVHSESLKFVLQRLSPAQAEALYLHLQNTKQEDIAKALKITQPSVHQRLQAAGVQVFTSIIHRFESTVTLL
jgi:Sigma-70, region 4